MFVSALIDELVCIEYLKWNIFWMMCLVGQGILSFGIEL